MKKLKGIVCFAVIFGSFAVSSVALAAWVGGGTWNYGVGYLGTYGYSNYHHSSKRHTATVKNGGRTARSEGGPKAWAKASITKIPPTGMRYYWNAW